MRKALEGHWVVAKKEYGVSLDSRTVLGKTYRRNTANHPIRFRGSLRAQSVLVALQRLVMASTSNHRIVGGTLHDPDSAPPSVALAVRLNCQQGQTRLGAETSFSVIQQSTRSHAPLVKLVALFTRSQHCRSVSSSCPSFHGKSRNHTSASASTVNSPKSKPRKDSCRRSRRVRGFSRKS